MISKLQLSSRIKDSISTGGKLISLQLLAFATGFFTARSQLLNQGSPLGVAFVAGVPSEHAFSAAVGALLGYLIPSGGISNIRYMGAVGIVAITNWLLSNFFEAGKKPIFSAITGGVGLFVLFIILAIAGESFISFPQLLGECLLCGGSSYFFAACYYTLEKNTYPLQPHQGASCLVAIMLLLTALSQFTIYDFSPATLLGILLVLYAARYGRESMGAVAGVALGFAVYIADPDQLSVALSFMVGGLLAGLFSPTGKIGCAVAFLLANGVILIQNDLPDAFPYLYESIGATVIFLLLPPKVNGVFNKVFSSSPQAPLVDGLRNSIVMRLSFASEALEDVSQTVEEVSGKLKKINAPSFEHLFEKTEDSACVGCSMRIYCWESNRGGTLSALLSATKILRKNGRVGPEDLTKEFQEHCIHPQKLLDYLTVHFNDFLMKDSANRRLQEIQGVLAEQFTGISQMLSGLSEEFHSASCYDYHAALEIRNALLSMEMNPLDVSCQIDRYGRLTAEIRLSREDHKKVNRAILLRELSKKCGKDFEVPTIAEGRSSLLLTLSEKAEYTVSFGVAQTSFGNNKLCGDAYQGFFDGRGRFIMIISDGMGKGGRAAVDGTMACGLMGRLLKAGFDPNSALKIVNSAMIYKSTDESLATVDLTILDLFSGITEFYKAGAPPTLLRKNKKATMASSEALPAGIVNGISFDTTQTTLSKGDVIVMVSDGALGDGTDWIGVELEIWKGTDATDLAQHIADYAKRRCPEGQEDDITVAVAIIEESY